MVMVVKNIKMKHLRCRCLGGSTCIQWLHTDYSYNNSCLAVCIHPQCSTWARSCSKSQSMQSVCHAISWSQSVLTTIFNWACLQCSAQRTYNTSEIDSIVWLCNSSDLRCYTVVKFKLPASRQSTMYGFAGELRSSATAIDREVSKSRHNSTTRLRIWLSNDEQRDNIEFYLYC